MILELAWRNSWRQPRRTILSSLAIAFTSAFLIFMPSLQNGSYISMVENTLRLFDGYAEIQQPGYRDNPEIRNSLTIPDSLISDLKNIQHLINYIIEALGAPTVHSALLQLAVGLAHNSITHISQTHARLLIRC